MASPMLLEDLCRDTRLEVRTVQFGRWADDEPAPVKVLHQLVDVFRYPIRLLRAAPHVVHLNTSLDRRAVIRDLAFASVTRILGPKLFIMWHGSEVELLSTRRFPWRLLVGSLLRRIDGIGLLSKEEEEALANHRNSPRRYVVRNGLDLHSYAVKRDVRRHWGIPEERRVLLFISRLIPAKGLLDVLRAMPAVVEQHRAHLIVVGDGPQRDAAQALANELGLAANVHFAGLVPEAEALNYYCGSDILVFPTYHPEGFPMTIFQSVAAGMGVVTTRIRAAADYLREPENCLFVPPRDPEALGAALDRLLTDSGLLEGMRARNRELARRFDRRVIAGEFAAIYIELAVRATKA